MVVRSNIGLVVLHIPLNERNIYKFEILTSVIVNLKNNCTL